MESIIESGIRSFKNVNWIEPSNLEELKEGIRIGGNIVSVNKETKVWTITEYISNKDFIINEEQLQATFENIIKTNENSLSKEIRFKSGREIIEECLDAERGNFRRIDFLVKKFLPKVKSLKDFLYLVRREVINGFLLKAEQTVNGKYVYFFTEEQSIRNEGRFIPANSPEIADIVISKDNLLQKLKLK